MIARSTATRNGNGRASAMRSGAFYAGQRALSEAGFALFGVVILIWTLLPLYHMVMLSLTPLSDSFAARFWPDNPTLENYRIVFTEDHFFLQDFWRSQPWSWCWSWRASQASPSAASSCAMAT